MGKRGPVKLQTRETKIVGRKQEQLFLEYTQNIEFYRLVLCCCGKISMKVIFITIITRIRFMGWNRRCKSCATLPCSLYSLIHEVLQFSYFNLFLADITTGLSLLLTVLAVDLPRSPKSSLLSFLLWLSLLLMPEPAASILFPLCWIFL